MTPRQARRERRAAERKTRKAEIRRSKADLVAEIGFVSQNSMPDDIGFVSQNLPAPAPSSRAAVNRANAQFSTGPRTPGGKLASSRNSTRHGLASGQITVPGEDPAAFEALLADLLEEHQPAEATEELFVNKMAQSYWLEQRAIRLQNGCFTENGVDEKQLSLFLRYGTTYNRAFHKALSDLHLLQKERRKVERGFVSQTAPKTTRGCQFVRKNDRSPAEKTGFVSQDDFTDHLKPAQTASKAA